MILTHEDFEVIHRVWPDRALEGIDQIFPGSRQIYTVAARWAYGQPNGVRMFLERRGPWLARMRLLRQGMKEHEVLCSPEATRLEQLGANESEILMELGVELRLTNLWVPGEIPDKFMFPEDFPED